MNKYGLILVFILSVFVSFSFAQNNRIRSLGGMTYGLSDPDNSLNPYDWGKNPAWLMRDEQQPWLRVEPSFERQWGDYKRIYDYRDNNAYGLSFTGVKPLGENGTFLGYTTYSYDQRNSVYRTLKHDSYAGEAFFATDTTTGDFKYNGPIVGFSYSFELLPNLFAGASVGYEILDGLKSIYSRTKTIYRAVNGKAGLVYEFSNELTWGIDFALFDNQESLEMKNEDGIQQVEIFNSRGETYFISSRKDVINQKVRKKGGVIGTQIYLTPLRNLETALGVEYSVSNTRIFLPNSYIKEYEEGLASFENYAFRLQSKYQIMNNFILGVKLQHSKDYSWSKNSARNLLLWEWNVKQTSAGVGASYYIKPLDLLVGAEYNFDLINADSSKYIDVRFSDVSSENHLIRLGAEYKIMANTFIRAGYNYGTEQVDLVSGGRDVIIDFATLGLGFTISELADMDLSLQYGKISPDHYSDYSRDRFAFKASIKLFSF